MKHLIKACLAFTILVLFVGCGYTNRQPRYDVPEPLEIETFRRYAENSSVDYFYIWKNKAYSKVEDPLVTNLSDSQRSILERHGQPDYRRKNFHATTGEIVDEWAWWDRKIIAQFVQNQLVFEGRLKDVDSYRIRYGYPNDSWTQKFDKGVRRDIWQYEKSFFKAGGTIVSFTDGELVSRHDY